MDLHLTAFLPDVGSAGVLKGENDLVDIAGPGLTVSSKCPPLLMVHGADTEGLLEGVFKAFLWCPSVTVAKGVFTIQGYLGQVMPPPFWRHTLPIVAVTSAAWPLCW